MQYWEILLDCFGSSQRRCVHKNTALKECRVFVSSVLAFLRLTLFSEGVIGEKLRCIRGGQEKRPERDVVVQ